MTNTHFLTITYVARANGYRVESGYINALGYADYHSHSFWTPFPFHLVAAKPGRVIVRVRAER